MASSPTSSSTSSPPSNSRRRPRVSAEHTLDRVRENQRRHRARRKYHIASLEQKLADTERLLTEARAQIAVLKAERDTANAFVCFDFSRHLDGDEMGRMFGKVVREACTRAHVGEERGSGDEIVGVNMAQPGADVPVSSINTLQSLIPLPSASLTAMTLPLFTPLAVGPPPCCTDTLSLSPASPVDPECVTCSTRPPPAPSESTTLCAQAFVMISQVNFRNVDAAQVRAWLGQGYRRAGKAGEGCSVENSVLWEVLDYISGM